MIKLIALDIDGTTINSKEELSMRVISAIRKASNQGIKIVFASGRPYSGIYPLLKKLKIKGNYSISFGGGMILDENGESIFERNISEDSVVKLINLAYKQGVPLQFEGTNEIYTTNKLLPVYFARVSTRVNLPIRLIDMHDIGKYTFFKGIMYGRNEQLTNVIDEMNNQSKETLQEFNFSKTASDVLEISPQGISKGNTLKIIAKKMNIASCEIMAIGDQENDIEMLKFADVSVAMGNAIDKVKKIASYHTSSNDEDGVAKAIETFALKQEG